MRKGEKLYNFLTKKMNEYESSPTLSPSANAAWEYAYAFAYLESISDSEFDEITKPDLEENVFLCTLCKSAIWRNPRYPLTEEEKNNFICSGCEQAVNEKRFY